MSNPTTTGKWTPEWLRRTVAIHWGEHKPDNEIICRLHNAALAAVTGRHNEVCYDYAKQLAAEREKVRKV